MRAADDAQTRCKHSYNNESTVKRSISSRSPNSCSFKRYRAHKIADTNLRYHYQRHKILVSGSKFSMLDLKFWHVIWSAFSHAFKRGPFCFCFFHAYFGQIIVRNSNQTAITPPPRRQKKFGYVHAWRVRLHAIRSSVPTRSSSSKIAKLNPEKAFDYHHVLLGWTSVLLLRQWCRAQFCELRSEFLTPYFLWSTHNNYWVPAFFLWERSYNNSPQQ